MTNPTISGAEILVRCLNEEQVEFVFGYPGGAVLHIYDEIFKQNGFKHILVRHEQAAVHAADAFSRATGKVGVALVTSGPGATNAVTGIATAYMDSIPLVVISGQVPVPAIGMDAFQEVDMVGITRPCVKHNFLVKDVKDIAATIKRPFLLPQVVVLALWLWIFQKILPRIKLSISTRKRLKCARIIQCLKGIAVKLKKRLNYC